MLKSDNVGPVAVSIWHDNFENNCYLVEIGSGSDNQLPDLWSCRSFPSYKTALIEFYREKVQIEEILAA